MTGYATDAAAARDRVNALTLDVQQLRDARARVAAAQVVRSPLTCEVAEVRVKDATAQGVSVEIVIVSEVRVGEKSWT